MSETGLDMVRRVAAECQWEPVPSDEEADYLLWNKTAFPFAPADHLEAQLRDLFTATREADDA